MDENRYTKTLQLMIRDVDGFFAELGLQNLPQSRKESMLDTAIDTIMDRILLRISPVLTEQDQLTLDSFAKKTNAPDEMLTYLLSVVPNFNEIAQEEVVTYKANLKQNMANIMNSIDKEADNINSHYRQKHQ